MGEVWKDIPGFEGAYQASTLGRIRSLDRVELIANRWGGVTQRQLAGKVLKLRTCNNGYLAVSLGKGALNRMVHRLVAMTFVPGDFSLQVNHKDGVRDSNRPENLEWVTCSDNHRHSYRQLDRKAHAWTKPVVLAKGDETLEFNSGNEAARFLGVESGSIFSAIRRNHACRGYEVNYV